jgi:4-amino-4-deoxy-L-arabinose transferase-like glycosyltransferase
MHTYCEPMSSWTNRMTLLPTHVVVMFVTALGLNIAFLLLYYFPAPKSLIGDEAYYYKLASALASGTPAEHIPLWPPLYANFMGAVFAVSGTTERLMIQGVQIGLWLINAVLWYQIVQRILLSPIAASTALALFLFSPDLIVFSHFLWPETLHLFFVLCALWLMVCYSASRAALLGAGVSCGLAWLTKLLLLPFVPMLSAVFLVLRTDLPWRQRMVTVSLFGLALTTTVLPTMIGNWHRHGQFIIADSAMFNLWVGLTDVERSDKDYARVGTEMGQFLRAGRDWLSRSHVYQGKIVAFVQHQGVWTTLTRQLDKQYFRLFHYQSFFTTQLPGGTRPAYKLSEGPLTTVIRLYSYGFHAVVLATSVLGLCFLRWQPWSWPHGFALFIAYNLGLFLFLHVKTRYVVQFLPMLMFFSVVAVHSLATKSIPTATSPPPGFAVSRTRIFLGAVLAVLIELIAFREFLFS